MSITRRYYRTLPRWGKRLSRRFVAAYGKPAGLWLPNDVTNKAYDFSSNRNIGTLNGGITTTASGWGTLGQAWNFGSTPLITIPDATSLSTPSAITVVVLANPANGTCDIASKDDAASNRCWFLDISVSQFRFRAFNSSNAGGGLAISSSVSLNTNYLVCATVVATGNTAIYLNGALSNSVATGLANIHVAPQAVRIGYRGSAYFSGNIGLAAIFPFALTAAQVSSLYQALITGEPYPLFEPQSVRRGYGIRSIVGGSSFKFRRTLSDYGTRVGSRQAIG